jgi:para-nitrobenzyl esterase
MISARLSFAHRLICLFLLLLASSDEAPAAHADEAGDVVAVQLGQVRGRVDERVIQFLGVPYAAPPVGPLRWAAPQAPEAWSGVRDCTKPALPAAQGAGEVAGGSENEDCLFVNICVPQGSADGQAKPVMVWLHGGGFSSGTANTYDPKRMATTGNVIVVAVEFRLNIFGYFGYPGLEGSGTFGLQDQQAALRWVRDNIAAFGGDPQNITLFGESGGAVATCAQLTSPAAKGLFHKAILQSGAVTTSWPRNAANLGPHGTFWLPLETVEAVGKEFAKELNIPDELPPDEALARLRQIPAKELLAHTGKFFGPAYGGPILPEHPVQALMAGKCLAVPTISGFTRDEARGIASGMQLTGNAITDETYPKLLKDAFGDRVAEVERQYPRESYPTAALAWAAIYTDRMFASTQFTAMRALAARAPVFAFEFADPHSPGLIPFLPDFPSGASHSGELPFLFDLTVPAPFDFTTGKVRPLSPEQQTLAAAMIRYWTQFAHTGDPNAAGLPPWPRFDGNAKAPQVQVLASPPEEIGPRDDVERNHRSEFWQILMAAEESQAIEP